MAAANGWRWVLAIVGGLVTLGVAAALHSYLSSPHVILERGIARAEEIAGAADHKAQKCCDRASDNETEIKVLRANVGAITDSLKRIENNQAYYMRKRGIEPISPAPE